MRPDQQFMLETTRRGVRSFLSKTSRTIAAATILLSSAFLVSCSEEITPNQQESGEVTYFSDGDIQSMKNWILSQSASNSGQIDDQNFPDLDFNAKPTGSDEKLISNYFNRIMFKTDHLINNNSDEFEAVVNTIDSDERLDKAAKDLLKSAIQLSREVLASAEYRSFYQQVEQERLSKTSADPCNCDPIYQTYVNKYIQCQAYGNYWGHCDAAAYYYQQWLNCKAKTVHCPAGFTYDGANCYSGVVIPSGYEGFIWNYGFYVKRNCGISTANNCCPPQYGYDGANCHYWGLYFPSNYEPFIWDNKFYVKPKCY